MVPAAVKAVGLRPFVDRLRRSQYCHSWLQQHLQSLERARDLRAVFAALDAAGLTQEFATMLAQAVAASDEAVVIHGPLTEAQMMVLAMCLAGRAVLWDGKRRLGG